MHFKSYLLTLFAVSAVGLNSCTDDGDDVGSNIQPSGDLLHTYSSVTSVETRSILSDTVLCKSDYLFLGQYTDSHFGTTQAEFMSQFDARLGGITLPDTNLVSSTDVTGSGILNSLLSDIDSNYGTITSITNPTDMVVDSAFFYINYLDEFMGDSTSLQAINVYALNKEIPRNKRYYTNTKVSDYCDKDTLLGSLTYQIAGKRIIKVPIDLNYAKRLANIYNREANSSIKTQSQFNKVFKGIYVAPSFNEGAIIKVSVAGILLYYHYQGQIHTTYNGEDVVVDSKSLAAGKNPLVSSLFISCNKSVERINVIHHPNEDVLNDLIEDKQFTYSATPAALYTAVDIPYASIMDSVRAKCADSSKVTFNSALLRLYTKDIDWSSKYSKTPSTYMMLIAKDSISDFFYYDKYPDGLYSMAAAWDSTCKCYPFDLSAAIQRKMQTGDESLLKNMVVLPITITSSDDNYYYYQQLWVTGARFYGSEATDKSLRPKIDLVYTKRE